MNNNTKASIYHGSLYGPDFGNNHNDLVINYNGNKCLTGKNNYVFPKNCYNFTNKNLIGVDAKDNIILM